ncbi:MAG: 2-5 ligase family protein [Proteobacteria bacterium]|nr:2-5 ligase family protein [Pseudomonadota bacterium]
MADADEEICLIEGSSTLRNVRRDFPEWHLGRSPFVFWALDVDLPAVRDRVAMAGQHMAGLLLDDYRRQSHITLDLCGFPAEVQRNPDDFGAEYLQKQCGALRLAGLSDFEIELGGLSSFSSAPFLSVVDRGGNITALRKCLAVDGSHRLFGSYVPHVTVGLYADEWPVEYVKRRLTGFPSGAALSCRIKRVSLMSYSPSEVAGALDLLGDYWFASGEMRWHAAAGKMGFPDFSG